MSIKLQNKNNGVTISNIDENGIIVVNDSKLAKIEKITIEHLTEELRNKINTILSMQSTVTTLISEISELTTTVNSLTN